MRLGPGQVDVKAGGAGRRSRRWTAGAAASLLLLAGCGFSSECPPGSPANDPNYWRAATRTDLPGVWQVSYAGNWVIEDGEAGWRYGPGDHFIACDVNGEPRYEGLLAPGDETALWQWDLKTGAGAPSQVAAGLPDRRQADSRLIRHDDGTVTLEVSYRRPFQSRLELSDTEVVVRYERMRINAAGDTLTGLRRERWTPVLSRVPLPGTDEGVWRVTLRRVDAALVAEPTSLSVLADAVPRDGATSPYAAGQVFDLTGNVEATSDAATPSRWVWRIYRTVYDAGGVVVDRQEVSELEGEVVPFTAEEAGTYTIRLWATDGVQWATSAPVELVVE